MSVPGPVIIDIDGKKLTDEDIKMLKHPMLGGVMIFFKNVESPDQLTSLVESILAINPLLGIFVDREGGNVQRLQKAGFRCWPAARTYGDLWDQAGSEVALQFTEFYGKEIGAELAKYKIFFNAAPVVDLHSDSDIIGGMDRAFHSKPDVVAALGEAFIKGLHAAGVHSTIKHFPNHGICKGDSHTTKPISDISFEELEKHHMVPFTQLASLTDAIMPAHITFTQVDKANPVGYSKVWLTMLREKYGFKGVIMSDCLSMAGADVGELPVRADKALSAGCDMLIVANQKNKLELLDKIATIYKPSDESIGRIKIYLSKKECDLKTTLDVPAVDGITKKKQVVFSQEANAVVDQRVAPAPTIAAQASTVPQSSGAPKGTATKQKFEL